jgi:hypothetical protein
MSHNTPESELEKLRLQRDAKFEEIVACLAHERTVAPASLADRDRLVEEAEALTDKWAAVVHHLPRRLSGTLQTLLGEHQEICQRIVEIIDSGPYDAS